VKNWQLQKIRVKRSIVRIKYSSDMLLKMHMKDVKNSYSCLKQIQKINVF